MNVPWGGVSDQSMARGVTLMHITNARVCADMCVFALRPQFMLIAIKERRFSGDAALVSISWPCPGTFLADLHLRKSPGIAESLLQRLQVSETLQQRHSDSFRYAGNAHELSHEHIVCV